MSCVLARMCMRVCVRVSVSGGVHAGRGAHAHARVSTHVGMRKGCFGCDHLAHGEVHLVAQVHANRVQTWCEHLDMQVR